MELTRRALIKGSAGILGYAAQSSAQPNDPLPSWNEGPAKKLSRIATFDQDGTTWVVAAIAPGHPEWKTARPFQSVLSGDKEAMGEFTLKDLRNHRPGDSHLVCASKYMTRPKTVICMRNDWKHVFAV
jgi:hypothetical protein